MRLPRLLLGLLLTGQPLLVTAGDGLEPVALRPVVAIIIDDLGDRLEDGMRAIGLSGQVTYSILPHTPYSRRFAQMVHAGGREVMLHQPMQALNEQPMGPGGLSLHMTRAEFAQTLRDNLDSVPYAQGVNNHMGSLLTRHPGEMVWLMEELLRSGGLYFVDSITTSQTVALKMAMEHQLPTLRRNIFLDHDHSDEAIRGQFARLIAQAKAVGSSLAIAHPYPETLLVLEELLPTLEGQGVELIPVSRLIDYRNERRERLWQASLFPLQRGVKSSRQ